MGPVVAADSTCPHCHNTRSAVWAQPSTPGTRAMARRIDQMRDTAGVDKPQWHLLLVTAPNDPSTFTTSAPVPNSSVPEPAIVVDFLPEVSPTAEPQPFATADETTAWLPTTSISSAPIQHARPIGIVIATWGCGVVLVMLLAGLRWIRCWRSIRRAGIEERPDLQRLLTDLACRLRVGRRLRLLVTGSRVGPAVVGIWRPTLLLPAAVVQNKSADELEPILAHELVHVRRGDLWVGMLQLIAQSLWWFHPLVWLANRLLSRDAERCCDEEVIAELGCDPARYARSLLDVLELKRTLQPVPAFPGVRPVEITSQRLERIMKLGHGCHKRTPWWCWLVMAVVSVTTLPGAALMVTADEAQGQPWPVVPVLPANREQAIDTPLPSRTYPAGDVLERIQRDLEQPEIGAKVNLENLLRSVARHDQHIPQMTWSGRDLVVRHTSSGHERIAKGIQFVLENGIQQILIEVHMISGAPASIAKLNSNWEVLAPDVPLGQSPTDHQLSPPAPFESRLPTEISLHTASVAETVEKRKPALCAVVEDADATSILKQVRADSKLMILAAPKFVTLTGQTALMQTISQRPMVVGFKKTATDQHEPQIRIVPSGLEMHLRSLPHSHDQIRLECQLELSDIREVKEEKLIRGPKQEPLTVQIPEIVATKINLAYDFPLGRTLLIGGLNNTSPDGKPISTMIVMRCAKFDDRASIEKQVTGAPPVPQPEKTENKLGGAVLPALAVSPVPLKGVSPAGYYRLDKANNVFSQPLPREWSERLETAGVELRTLQPVKVTSSDTKLELTGRVQLSVGAGNKSTVIESQTTAFLFPDGFSAKPKALTVECSGDTRLNLADQIRGSAEIIRIQVRDHAELIAELSGNVALEGNEFVVRANNVSISRSKMLLFCEGNVELNRKVGHREPSKLRGEKLHLDVKFRTVRIDGFVVEFFPDARDTRTKVHASSDKPTREPSRVFAKTYYVEDLVTLVTPVFVPHAGMKSSGPKTIAIPAGGSQSHDHKRDFATLMELITGSIEPGSWMPNGIGAIEKFPSNLSIVVSHTEEVHERIAELLQQLRSLQFRTAFETRVIGLTKNGSVTALSEESVSSNNAQPQPDELAVIQLTDRHTRMLLQAAQQDPASNVSEATNIVLLERQIGNIVFGDDDSKTNLQFYWTANKDRRSIDLRCRIGAFEATDVAVHSQTPVNITNGNSLVLDVTKSIPTSILGEAWTEEFPMLGKLPHLGQLFRKAKENPIEHVYLLITPRKIEIERTAKARSWDSLLDPH